jgi:hypothetical protein
MYAGTTIRRGSGKIVGVHQKIDRSARRHLKIYIPKSIIFPTIKEILHFEGNNGPDGIKRKSSSVDQPWYFIDPAKSDDRDLIIIIDDHIFNLSVALKENNNVRAAFESAWLAHAIVDGLTPAHHYPLGDKIAELWGKSHDERTTIRDRNIIHGANLRDTLSKNWEYWGKGGVFTTHGMFEIGVASAVASDNYKDLVIDKKLIIRLKKDGFEPIFYDALKKIDSLKMYDQLGEKGWTARLAKQTKKVLIPEMIIVVMLAWYQAIIMTERG